MVFQTRRSAGTAPANRAFAPAAAKPKTTAPALSAADQHWFTAKQTNLNENLGHAVDQKATGFTQAQATYRQNLNTLGAQRIDAETDLMGKLSARGTAFDPMFAGQGLADVGSAYNTAATAALTERDNRKTALAQMLATAELENRQGTRMLKTEKELRRAELGRLIRGVGGVGK